MDGNPFGDLNPAQGSPAMAGNPFAPVEAPAPTTTQQQQPQQDPYARQTGSPTRDSVSEVGQTADNPFGSTMASPQPVAAPVQYGASAPATQPAPASDPFAQGPYAQYNQQNQPTQDGAPSQGAALYQQGGNDAFGGPPQPAAPVPTSTPYQNAMVPSQQPSNPYAGIVAPSGQDNFGGQHAIVPATQQGNQWAVGPAPAQPSSSAAPFDPFAPPPPPAAVPRPAPPQPAPPQQATVTAAPRETDQYGGAPAFAGQQQQQSAPQNVEDDNPFGPFDAPPPAQEQKQPPQTEEPRPSSVSEASSQADRSQRHRPDSAYNYGSQLDPPHTEVDEDNNEVPLQNKYREELARRAPPGASPLPKAELVRKRGYVLARISFRTIVMKKWKQSYWVQYGPHTMLWFRSESDFDDWLNNPYHNQAQRNFLIKLAVNFVHDLYKPNVRGYQVTQCRTKAYGKKMVRQFKLERWMDYGPTIAAAFGSYNPKEVDDLREALVECMRNTPLNGGIRATGAVRQPEHEHYDRRGSEDTGSHRDEGGYRRNSGDHSEMQPNENVHPSAAESVAEEADLLDVDNWDDVPLQHPQQPAVPPNVSPYGGQQQQAYGYGQAPPYPTPQQPGYQNAMVPAAHQPQAYPGAPPMPQYPQQQQQAPPPQYQQQAPPQQAPPPQQQQAPPPQQQYPAAQQDPWATPGQQQQPYPQPYQPPQQMGF